MASFSVCDKFFFGSSFLKNKNGPELFPGPLLFLFHFLPGDACQAPAFRAALHTIYPYESFRGEGMGFG
ncbi:hypothetical protein, partial [Bilophila wadsworthia]|uniref:hypothetical protein n=1 Tax=Bilophila wadsworthia TaxID=35833 RepID=UPI0028E2FDA8